MSEKDEVKIANPRKAAAERELQEAFLKYPEAVVALRKYLEVLLEESVKAFDGATDWETACKTQGKREIMTKLKNMITPRH
jgi:hypothetical protein